MPAGVSRLNGSNDLCDRRASATVWLQTRGHCLKREQVLEVDTAGVDDFRSLALRKRRV